ncbi:translation factor GTPase family protein [Marvinbryantia formatexigens]|nr:TetM/TetW/TetO/TetS family tetracycline resistance ribosomal protection protein [Marvinbryantia formatexigens]UWO25417.1 TetM/TetW/TetO/TetS family tetracycline resistance ribosomal protection protein [Marvinbryantia formatexigens DSM 14469]SDG74308.1 small GTP-binding protein domain-containing protein [Marvinbryantia formatexigens]
MGNSSENKSEKIKKHICVGILAHVDAGKTTLAESMLYRQGSIRTMGRVDHGNAFLDNYELERARGITIFSKQAILSLGDKEVTLLDTPGHVDFSAEMERTLQVLDYAILVISQADGVQGHVLTLWKLLQRYQIPVFVFVNKMDQESAGREAVLAALQERLDGHCLDFGAPQGELKENLAMCDEETLERYLETETVTDEEIRRLIRERRVFPCCFGSALKNQGVEEFLAVLSGYTSAPVYPEDFSARVYKISRDAQGNRLTHLKITGGSLKVKTALPAGKVDQIRIYSGANYQVVQEAEAGSVCAVTGLADILPGEGLGAQTEGVQPALEPVLRYRVMLPEGCDVHGMLGKLRQLEEEDPLLRISWEEDTGEIHAQVMGEVQMEILQSIIRERFGTEVSFGKGSIVYKETITKPVEGVGHFEPLRHYAEVHLLLEPGERGSGLVFDTAVSEDELDRNWQRLILTNLAEKKHVGVLTGAQITDMKITVIAGRAHLKHTEGGDFREAAWRAVRQGLRSTESILLEPVYEFRLEVPQENIGRAMADFTRMHGVFSQPEQEGDYSVLRGTVPASSVGDYQKEVTAYTKGRGRLFCSLKGYEPCHNQEEIIAAAAYDPDADTDNPSGSVFCAHGAGFYVPWDSVRDYMHVESHFSDGSREEPQEKQMAPVREKGASLGGWASDKELEEIFTRTYGAGKEARSGWGRSRFSPARTAETGNTGGPRRETPKEEYLLVDGYNIIFAWEELRELARINIESARGRLADILCNYQGFRKNTVILVFDAYRVEGGTGSVQKYHNIYVVYTREAETADQYIEKTVHKISPQHHVTVATSDALEQMIIWGAGASRLSAAGLLEEIEASCSEIRRDYLTGQKRTGEKLFDKLPEDLAALMEDIRLGRRSFAEQPEEKKNS